ncbi:MAG: biotin/lipoyl-containing protein [Candidatus Thorarchaeota archaeon]|jgi:biotin carboxyl carrier protein
MMSSEYDIKLEDRNYQVSIKKLDEGGLLIVKVGDESFTLKVEETEDGTWSVNDTYTDHTIKITSRTSSKAIVEINGDTREIDWVRVRKQAEAESSVGVPASGSKKVAGGVYPPMPGKITEVKVKVGDAVKSGDTVCILEAMKMFNELKATSSGTVKEVNVETGSNVTPNDLIVLVE